MGNDGLPRRRSALVDVSAACGLTPGLDYNPNQNRWRIGPPLPKPMDLLATTVDDRIHAVLESTTIYDGRTAAGRTAFLEVPRHALGLFSADGRLYAIGGCINAAARGQLRRRDARSAASGFAARAARAAGMMPGDTARARRAERAAGADRGRSGAEHAVQCPARPPPVALDVDVTAGDRRELLEDRGRSGSGDSSPGFPW